MTNYDTNANLSQDDWDASYKQRDNFLFYPHEEVVRFVSKYIRKKTGLDEFTDVCSSPENSKILDLGCGIGRHIKYCSEMGLDAYGIDLSEIAVNYGRDWLLKSGISDSCDRILQGDVQHLPWEDENFSFALSHGVLDSMSWETSRNACKDLARTMVKGGLFYCDLISGDCSSHYREYSGEEIVKTLHENNTTQLYFNMQKILDLFTGYFKIRACKLIREENVLESGFSSRYHLVLSKI